MPGMVCRIMLSFMAEGLVKISGICCSPSQSSGLERMLQQESEQTGLHGEPKSTAGWVSAQSQQQCTSGPHRHPHTWRSLWSGDVQLLRRAKILRRIPSEPWRFREVGGRRGNPQEPGATGTGGSAFTRIYSINYSFRFGCLENRPAVMGRNACPNQLICTYKSRDTLVISWFQ